VRLDDKLRYFPAFDGWPGKLTGVVSESYQGCAGQRGTMPAQDRRLSIRPRKVSEYQPPHCDRQPSHLHSPFLSRSGNYSAPFAPRFSPCGLLLSFSERQALRRSATRYRDGQWQSSLIVLERSRENAATFTWKLQRRSDNRACTQES